MDGDHVRPYEPVLVVEGPTPSGPSTRPPSLAFCQASGIATRVAARAAGERQVISARGACTRCPHDRAQRLHRRCDGVAVTKAAELIDADPMGTTPHALVLMFGETVEDLRAFHEVVDPKVRRVALIDTLQDEKFEAIRVAEALGKDLYAVRLDTPSSRRGDFFRILDEVRWELDFRGFDHVKILASGGIDEYEILKLNPLVDGYGVGTAIANAPALSFALDIMEIEGRPMAKRGKRSGAKQVWRMPGSVQNTVLPARSPLSDGLLRRGPALAPHRLGPPRARPAAAPEHPRVRAGADAPDRHRRLPGAGPARGLLRAGPAAWASWMRSCPTSAPRWPAAAPPAR